MLRSALMAIGGIILAIGIVLLFILPVWPAGIPAIIIGILIVGGLLLERTLYHATADKPPTDPGWEMMSERFVDPGTEELMVVWFNRRTGKRLYVRSGPV